ncbi:1521_t:CDS:2, partial [Diversispora eburnea]
IKTTNTDEIDSESNDLEENDEKEIKNLIEDKTPEKINYIDVSDSDLSENDSISREGTPCSPCILNLYMLLLIIISIKEQENTIEEEDDRYDYFSPLSVLQKYRVKENTSPYDYEQWSKLLKRPNVIKKTNHHEIEPFIKHLFYNMDLSQARSKWDELQNINAPEYKNEFSYKNDEWKKIRWWIHQVIGQFLDAFESFQNPLLEHNCNERQWTGDYIIPLMQGVLKLDGRYLALWGEASVLATQRCRNNNKDINTKRVTRSHLADFLCKYEQNEIVCGLVCLHDRSSNLHYGKARNIFLHYLKSFNLPISFSSYNNPKFALRTMWNI